MIYGFRILHPACFQRSPSLALAVFLYHLDQDPYTPFSQDRTGLTVISAVASLSKLTASYCAEPFQKSPPEAGCQILTVLVILFCRGPTAEPTNHRHTHAEYSAEFLLCSPHASRKTARESDLSVCQLSQIMLAHGEQCGL